MGTEKASRSNTGVGLGGWEKTKSTSGRILVTLRRFCLLTFSILGENAAEGGGAGRDGVIESRQSAAGVLFRPPAGGINSSDPYWGTRLSCL